MQSARFAGTGTMRSRLMLEVASELVGRSSWPDKQVQIHFREQGATDWRLCFFASDAPNAVDAVASGQANFAICNPGGILAMAVRGAGPFKEPLPLRAIMVIPQIDRLGFAVTEKSGISSISEFRDGHAALRVSLRGQRDHSVHLYIDQLLTAYGFTLDDIRQWGGQVRYDPGIPTWGRLDAVKAGEIDVIIDEAFHNYAQTALDIGMRFLPIDEPELQKLEAAGLRRVAVKREEYPQFPADLWTVDFSGWPVFTLASTSDDMVTAFCAALEARKERVPWYGEGPLDLALMVSDTPEAPMMIPLHLAAERFWRGQGYL